MRTCTLLHRACCAADSGSSSGALPPIITGRWRTGRNRRRVSRVVGCLSPPCQRGGGRPVVGARTQRAVHTTTGPKAVGTGDRAQFVGVSIIRGFLWIPSSCSIAHQHSPIFPCFARNLLDILALDLCCHEGAVEHGARLCARPRHATCLAKGPGPLHTPTKARVRRVAPGTAPAGLL